MDLKRLFSNKKRLYLGLTLVAYSLLVYFLSDVITGTIGIFLLIISIYLIVKSFKERTKKVIPGLLLLMSIHTLNVTNVNIQPVNISAEIESNSNVAESEQSNEVDKNKDETSNKTSNVSNTGSSDEIKEDTDASYEAALKAIDETIETPSRSNLEYALVKVDKVHKDKQEISDKLDEAERLVIDEEAKKTVVEEKIKLAEEVMSRDNYNRAITSFEELLIYDNQLKKRLNIINKRLTDSESLVNTEKEETEQVEEASEVFDGEAEYNEAQAILDDVLNNAFSDLGYWEYNEATYSFVFSITDQELITSIGLIMNGQAPKELWSNHMTAGLLRLSETIGYTYGYGSFALEVRNPYDEDYVLLEVEDGFIIYDFVEEL